MVVLAVVLTFMGTALGVTVLLVLLIPPANPQLARLRQLGAAVGTPQRTESTSTRKPGRIGAVQQLAEWLGRTFAVQHSRAQSSWRKLLVQAGYRRGNAVLAFQGYRLLLAGLLPGTFLLVAPHFTQWTGVRQLAAVLALIAAGLFLPHWWLLQRIKWRAEEISDALPNALDLMVVCVEAGLGLDATIQRLAQEQQFTRQALAEEFQIVSQETRTGRPRSEALLAMKERVGVAELSSFIVVLVQAEKMGTGIARSLRVHADSLRTKRRQRAE